MNSLVGKWLIFQETSFVNRCKELHFKWALVTHAFHNPTVLYSCKWQLNEKYWQFSIRHAIYWNYLNIFCHLKTRSFFSSRALIMTEPNLITFIANWLGWAKFNYIHCILTWIGKLSKCPERCTKVFKLLFSDFSLRSCPAICCQPHSVIS